MITLQTISLPHLKLLIRIPLVVDIQDAIMAIRRTKWNQTFL